MPFRNPDENIIQYGDVKAYGAGIDIEIVKRSIPHDIANILTDLIVSAENNGNEPDLKTIKIRVYEPIERGALDGYCLAVRFDAHKKKED